MSPSWPPTHRSSPRVAIPGALALAPCRNREMASVTNVYDYEELAKHKLSKMVYDFYAGGAEDQWTLNENKEAFSRICKPSPS
ncbi:hypothetical protein PR202_gb14341 [Eleusine coracana subsp. coracana]|uniref:FMN-dependent dehydrogenase domain-containing protein n=1 Tax=Eleusine coracana subsp. coracana TaxID=191504 RepID=A0AAV5ESN2_ELECO|nr:hypothetical protein PR202_gb14341 [Eleusine coracana subsp. coracana]